MGINKRVLLFSAGMDSFIYKKIFGFTDEECLFVDMGTKENKIEKQFIAKYFPKTQQYTFPLSVLELPNKIIPFRNNHIALLAANYANNIHFAFTAGDTTKDKDYVFKAQMESILNYFAQDKNKVKVEGPFAIHMDFKNFTKTELVAIYLKEKHPINDLFKKSSSCYEGKAKPCGVCRSCLRKYVALENNRINTTGYWKEEPGKYLGEFLKESIDKNREKEIEEIKTCVNRNLLYHK